MRKSIVLIGLVALVLAISQQVSAEDVFEDPKVISVTVVTPAPPVGIKLWDDQLSQEINAYDLDGFDETETQKKFGKINAYCQTATNDPWTLTASSPGFNDGRRNHNFEVSTWPDQENGVVSDAAGVGTYHEKVRLANGPAVIYTPDSSEYCTWGHKSITWEDDGKTGTYYFKNVLVVGLFLVEDEGNGVMPTDGSYTSTITLTLVQ